MTKTVETICIRCGKMRIFLKKWSEKTEGRGTLVTYTQSVCPDKECQKVVDATFAAMLEKRVASDERRKHNLSLRKTKK